MYQNIEYVQSLVEEEGRLTLLIVRLQFIKELFTEVANQLAPRKSARLEASFRSGQTV